MESEQTTASAVRYMGESGLANFYISFARENMEAYIQIFGKGTDLTMDDIVAGVKAAGITRGVSRKIVDGILAGKHGKEPILFAKGAEPQRGKDGWFEFFFRTHLEKIPKEFEDGSVDYQNVEWFEVVEEDQKIVEYHPAEEGINGYTVLGKVIPAKKGKDLPQLRGKNFRISDDKIFYYANMGGRIIFENSRIEISRLFILDEMSIATGNLEFDGSVQVRGNIGSGITLKATEDIVIDGFVESAVISAGGSIMFRQGMNAGSEGLGKGFVEAGEYIAGKFFEAVKINCQGSIQADYLLNCEIFSRETVLVSGKKGSIAGGEAYALQGFIARNVGNRVGLATKLRVGFNDDILREQMSIEDSLKQVAKSVQGLKHSRNEFETQYSPEECFAMPKYNKIVELLEAQEKSLEKLEKRSAEMESYIEKLRAAQIVVNNVLYDGVTCEINNQKYTPDSVKNVTIKMIGQRIAIFENQISK